MLRIGDTCRGGGCSVIWSENGGDGYLVLGSDGHSVTLLNIGSGYSVVGSEYSCRSVTLFDFEYFFRNLFRNLFIFGVRFLREPTISLDRLSKYGVIVEESLRRNGIVRSERTIVMHLTCVGLYKFPF